MAADGFACCAAIRSRMHAVTIGFDIAWWNGKSGETTPFDPNNREGAWSPNSVVRTMDDYKKVVTSKLKFKGSVLPVKEKGSKWIRMSEVIH